MRDAKTIKNSRQSEQIANYRRLRLIQVELESIKNSVDLVGLDLHNAKQPMSNAIDQIEQAIEKIREDTSDIIVLEILNEIDGEVRY